MRGGSKLSFFATTVVGLEDVCAGELREILGVEPEVDTGKVFFKGDLDTLYKVNFSSRTTSRLFILLLRDSAWSLEDVYRLMKSIDYTEFIAPDKTFAIRSERVGEHSFTSIDVSRVAGQAVIDSYLESTGTRLKVNLDNPDVEIWVFVRFSELLVGINTTGEGLHRRKYRVYRHPAALKTTIASGMLRLGNYMGQPLLDPLCGGGTIPIEAAHLARRVPIVVFRRDYMFRNLRVHNPWLEAEIAESLRQAVRRDLYEVYCMDISPRHLKGAVENAKSALVDDTIKFFQRDATREESYLDINAELVVTNPPYGIRSHRLEKIKDFYKSLLCTLSSVYSGSKLVLITASTRQFEEAIAEASVVVEHHRRVLHGGLPAKVYVVKL